MVRCCTNRIVDGDDDHVEIGPGALPSGQKSFFAWVKLPPTSQGSGLRHDYYIYQGRTDDGGAIAFYFNNGVELRWLHYRIGGPAWHFDARHTIELDDDHWHHVGITYDGSEHVLYADGVAVATVEAQQEYQRITHEEGIGGFQGDTTSRSWLGCIDQVLIYDRALSVDEVQMCMGAGDPLLADVQQDDYHLKSKYGRYWAEHDVWVIDSVMSPCIDGGDPNSDYSLEMIPNGGRINMGVYGNTPFQAEANVRIRGLRSGGLRGHRISPLQIQFSQHGSA